MTPPSEVVAERELVDVSQLTNVPFTGAMPDSSDDESAVVLTPNKRHCSKEDPEALGEDELASTPHAPKKPRPSNSVRLSSETDVDNSSAVDATATTSSTADSSNPTCKDYWIENQNLPGVLLAMCIGVKVDDDPDFAIVTEDNFYKTSDSKSKFKPTKIMLINEVKRRHKIYFGHDKDKKCASYDIPKLIVYLLTYPIVNKEDVEFLLAEEKKFRDTLIAAQKERTDLSDLHEKEDSWLGDAPWLRLYHVMICERVQMAYRTVNQWEGRQGTDARNSEIKPKSFYEVAADMYNSPTFELKSLRLPMLHDNFASRIDLSRHANMPTVSPEKIQKKLAEARAKLMKMIADWEKSGNGSGQVAEGTSHFGHIIKNQRWLNVRSTEDGDDASEFMDGDNRSCFLGTRRPHLLYMWELFDKHNLLDQTLNKMADCCSATDEHTPKTLAPKKKTEEKKASAAQREQDILQINERTALAMKSIADSQWKSQMVAMENTLMLLQDRLMSETVQKNETFKQDFQQQVDRMKKQIEDMYAKLAEE